MLLDRTALLQLYLETKERVMQQKVRNILIDINGCLQGPTPVELHEALPELWRLIQLTNGGSFLIGACSGRELPYVRGVLHLLGSPNGWSIYES